MPACPTLFATFLPCLLAPAGGPELTVAGDWTIRAGTTELAVKPAEMAAVTDEKFDRLPVYNPKVAGWTRGAKLHGLVTQETTARFMLVPGSVVLKSAAGADGKPFVRGTDWEIDDEWGTFGRLEGGAIAPDTPVWADYQHGLCRLDSVVATADGKLELRTGVPHINVPHPPAAAAGERRLANVWVPGRTEKLSEANLFPIQSDGYPEPPQLKPTPVERLCPKTLAKLRAGETVKVLAWGDSVTNGTFVGDLSKRWQMQFATALGERWPSATVEVIHLGWGGRNTASFLAEPPGSEWNYQEKVVNSGADLIVSEFVNDAYLKGEALEERYTKFLNDFQGVGAEWIILSPHYVRPDWMGLPSERDCDDDPRPYVIDLRKWCAAHDVPLADASLRWGHLWREGIPYTTLLLNAINHPDARGMKLFSDALMWLFPEK